MTVVDVLRAIGEDPACGELVGRRWDESVNSLPAGGLDFLAADNLRAYREFCRMGDAVDADLARCAHRVAGDPALTRLAWHAYRTAFDYDEPGAIRDWPTLAAALGDLAGVFYLVVALGMVPRVRKVHSTMGVDETVTRDTCSEIRDFCDHMHRPECEGKPGLLRSQMYWLRHYTDGRLFRLGRFEYKIEPFRDYVVVYQHRTTRQPIALAGDGRRFDDSGHSVPADEPGWTATVTDDGKVAVGYPVDPNGFVVHRQVHLPRDQWDRILDTSTPVLDMHIPAGGRMTPDACRDSFRGAVAFFAKHFPDQPARAIACGSWTFNTQLREILPAEANLVRFLRELYLFPIDSSIRCGWHFIFHGDYQYAELHRAPRDTSIQRAVIDYVSAGHMWRGGGMFFLTEDVERFGDAPYQAHWALPANV